MLDIETADTIFEIEFGHIQIEITGYCNMHCAHCRASEQPNVHMPISQINKVIQFAEKHSSEDFLVVVSGGEPLLHKEFGHCLEVICNSGGKRITLTTNGSVLNQGHLDLITRLPFEWVQISVSLDSVDPDTHDSFRQHKGAFNKAVKALNLIIENNMRAAIRATIQPHQVEDMEAMIEFGRNLGIKRIGFSPIQPAGKAIQSSLCMNKDTKLRYMIKLRELDKRFPDIAIGDNDPLNCLLDESAEDNNEYLVIDGCGAASTTFNVNPDGTMTPCALLDIPIMNILELSVKQIATAYKNSSIVKSLVTMKFKGKCGDCDKKAQCGGCRARAYAECGDYLGPDPHCWLPDKSETY